LIPIPDALQTHLQGAVTTHCFCWRVTRADGAVLGFTDHDRRLEFGGTAFEPQTGLTASEATTSLGLGTDSVDVEGALSSDAISDADIEAGRYDGAIVETFLVNWQSPDQHVRLRRATIGTITRLGNGYKATVQSAAADLDKVKGRRITRGCDAEFGDARCGIDAATSALTGSGTVSVARSSAEFDAAGLAAYAPGWFERGLLKFVSGANEGASFVVLRHVLSGGLARLTLRDVPLFAVAADDTFSVIAGCDKTFATCRAKFSNPVNFRGFPHLPGNDAAYAYANGDQTFDGGPLVP
jgi:uncharacterized phage protein (TIGR02218 family)